MMVDAEFRNPLDSSDSSPTANPKAPVLPTGMTDSQSAIGKEMRHLNVDNLDVADVTAARDDQDNNSVSRVASHTTRKISEKEAREQASQERVAMSRLRRSN
jgi:hypothetical protein